MKACREYRCLICGPYRREVRSMESHVDHRPHILALIPTRYLCQLEPPSALCVRTLPSTGGRTRTARISSGAMEGGDRPLTPATFCGMRSLLG